MYENPNPLSAPDSSVVPQTILQKELGSGKNKPAPAAQACVASAVEVQFPERVHVDTRKLVAETVSIVQLEEAKHSSLLVRGKPEKELQFGL